MTVPQITGRRLALASAAASFMALWLAILLVRAPLADLVTARADHRRHEAIAAQAPTPAARSLPLGEMIGARTATAASDRLARLLQKRALDDGLLVEALDPRAGTALAEVGITLSGNEAAVLRFIADVEGDRPLIRLRSWRLDAGTNAKVLRLTAIAVALWSEDA